MAQINHLEIILKIVEVCNINCSYCYFFNGIDDSFKKHPPYIKQNTVTAVANFLKDAVSELNVRTIKIDLHGGEPLMLKPRDFIQLCTTFREVLSPVVELEFVIQTNAMLINPTWIEIFRAFEIYVGVSLDGPKVYNDIYRIDKRGSGTYDRVLKGVHYLMEAAAKGLMPKPAALSVINPEFSAVEIYRHFVDGLGFEVLDFLLPDLTYDQVKLDKTFSAPAYGNYLVALFNEWTKDDNPNINIRILNSTLSMMLGGKTSLHGFGEGSASYAAFTIASNGDLAPDDTLRSTKPAYMQTGMNVFNTSSKEFLAAPFFETFAKYETTLPSACEDCQWRQICRGGMLINRYSEADLFSRESVLCAGLKLFYREVYDFLVTNEVPTTMMRNIITTHPLYQ